MVESGGDWVGGVDAKLVKFMTIIIDNSTLR